MAELRVEQVSKAFDGVPVLEKISLQLHEKELVALLGVSGAGKTTLFNVISGLLLPEEGRVYLDGEDITGKPGNVSYMLQKDLLLPYRTIEDNVALPLMIRGEKKKKPGRRCSHIFRSSGWRVPRSSTRRSFPAG